MLLKKDLIESVDEKYRPMLNEVSIPDFTKCIAQFSGLHITDVADEAIEEYLTIWAKNKYRFYQLLGNKTRLDSKIKYEEDIEDKQKKIDRFVELAKEYPVYSLWLYSFSELPKNKIEDFYLSYGFTRKMEEVFPNRHFEGISLTHFFKNYISAPDDLVTEVGRVFESQEIEANYTISIDPVDMMLASENPYNWTSCYRIENCEGTHGDGVLAAMLDDSSLITYIWNKSGDFSLYGKYPFKNLRYKRMRQYISISPTMNAIHFNSIYPGKGEYPKNFEKLLREKVENLIDKEAIWVSNTKDVDDWNNVSDCDRKYLYGYGEFSDCRIYIKKGSDKEIWQTYNEEIICPCGCKGILYESDSDDEDMHYNGEGYTYENAYERHYCEWCDEYCENYDDGYGCEDCPCWRENNAVCELDTEHYCEGDTYEAGEAGLFDKYESNLVHCDPEFCSSCPFYELHHQESYDDLEEERRIAKMAA